MHWHGHNINFDGLMTFGLVADLGNMTRAAEQARINQTNVSKSISLLEYLLKRKLYQRHRRGVYLTEEGKALKAVLAPFENALLSYLATERQEQPLDVRDRLISMRAEIDYILAELE